MVKTICRISHPASGAFMSTPNLRRRGEVLVSHKKEVDRWKAALLNNKGTSLEK